MKDVVIIGCCRSGHNFIRDQIESWGFNTFNYEDVIPGSEVNIVSKGRYPDNPVNVIVVRDLYNWWASYIKWITKSKLDTAFEIWYKQALEGFNYTNYIQNKYLCLYDEFKDNRQYREDLCNKLEGIYSEERLSNVPTAGGGSSFGNLNTSNRVKDILKTEYREIYLEYLQKHKKIVDFWKKVTK